MKTLIEAVQGIYGKATLDLPIAMAAAAANWFYGGHEAAIEALEASGEGAIETAIDAADEEFGRGWRPLLLNTPFGVLSFIPVPSAAYEAVLERIRAFARSAEESA